MCPVFLDEVYAELGIYSSHIAPRLRGRVGKVTETLKRLDLLPERLRHVANWELVAGRTLISYGVFARKRS